MEVIELDILTESSAKENAKAPVPMEVTESGTSTYSNCDPKKAITPIFVTESAMSIDPTGGKQPRKASYGIKVTVSGILT